MPEGIQVFVIEGQNAAHNAMSAVSGTDPGKILGETEL
jgi:hypothetical protein